MISTLASNKTDANKRNIYFLEKGLDNIDLFNIAKDLTY